MKDKASSEVEDPDDDTDDSDFESDYEWKGLTSKELGKDWRSCLAKLMMMKMIWTGFLLNYNIRKERKKVNVGLIKNYLPFTINI